MKNVQILILVFLFNLPVKAQFILGTYHGDESPKIVKIKTDIRALNEDKTSLNGKNVKILGGAGTTYRVRSEGVEYFINKSDIDPQIEDELKAITPMVGAFSFAFKYRPQSGIMEPNFSLSVSGGPRFRLDNDAEHHLSALVGVGQSSIILNEENTDPSASITGNSTRAAVTFSLTVLYQWKQLQIGASAGIDDNLNNKKDKWIYQSKPWLTLGIGFSIFSETK